MNRSKNITKLNKLEDLILTEKQLNKHHIVRFQAKLRSAFGNRYFDQLPAHHPKNNAYLSSIHKGSASPKSSIKKVSLPLLRQSMKRSRERPQHRHKQAASLTLDPSLTWPSATGRRWTEAGPASAKPVRSMNSSKSPPSFSDCQLTLLQQSQCQ